MICQLYAKYMKFICKRLTLDISKKFERFQKTKRSCSTVTLWLLVIYTPSLPWTHDLGWVSNPPKSKWSSPVKKGKDHLNHHKTIRKPSKPGVLRNADVFVLEKVQDSKPLRTPRKDWDSHMRLALIDLKLYRMCCIHLYTWKFTWLLHNQQQLKFNMATFRGSTPPLLALFLSCPVSIRYLIYGNITISDSWSWFLVSWSSVFIIINSIGNTKILQDIQYMYWQFKQTELYMHMPV